MGFMSKSKDVRINAVLNVIKQLCAVIFPLITFPYISRVLGADNYGKVNFAHSVVSYFVVFASLGLQSYGTREGARLRNNKEQVNQFASEVFSLNTLAVLIAYGVLAALLLCVDAFSGYTGLILVQSLVILFNWIGMDWVNSAFEDYTFITVRYIVAQILSIAAMFLFVRDSEDYFIYAVITVLAGSGANLLNLIYIRKYVRVRLRFTRAMFRHLAPLLILLGNAIAVSIYINSDVTVLGLMRTDAEVGIYSVATKVYTIVKQLMNAMLIVFVPRLSALVGNEQETEYRAMLNKLFGALVCLLLPTIMGLMMLSEEVVLLISGAEFSEARKSLAVLCVSLGFAVFACFFSNCVLLPMKRDKRILTATATGCVVNVVLNFIAIPYLGHVGAAITTAIAEAVVMVMCFLFGKKFAGLSVNIKDVLPPAVGCGMIAVVVLLVKRLCADPLWTIAMSVVGSVIAYLLVLVLLGNPLVVDVIRAIKRRKKL